MDTDKPYALSIAANRKARQARLHDPHVAPLTRMVATLRKTLGPAYQIPDFDPHDGGVRAKALFLLEAPGPKAVKSGFISRNNPDPTARNMHEMLARAGLRRRDTVLWNVVPWYLGNGRKIAAATNAELISGAKQVRDLLPLLPSVRCVVLVGKKAQRAAKGMTVKGTKIYATYHPSNRVRYLWPSKWRSIQATFKQVAREIRRK